VSDLRAEVIRLGPWHIDVEVTPNLSTSAFLDAPPGTYPPSLGKVGFEDATFRDPRGNFMRTMERIYPDGLTGRTVLDCACNCGAFLFWAKELGAGDGFGFDVREHWIEQARFLATHRTLPSDGISFEVCDLYDVPKLALEPLDITVFKGVFHQLPDPLRGLKIAADLTRELLVVNTATGIGFADGLLAAHADRKGHGSLMSGVHGLGWMPTGPEVMTLILNWLGFPETRCIWWHSWPPQRRHGRERLEILAARDADVFRAFDESGGEEGPAQTAEIVRAAIPRGATVLVVSEGDEQLLKLGRRRGWHFPQDEAGSWLDRHPADAAAVIAQLEESRSEGAEYLLLPSPALSWLDRYPELFEYLENRYRIVTREKAGLIFSLAEG
jgi:tRNA (mo5U34)-methyltransferase